MDNEHSGAGRDERTIVVWDGPVRIVHWALAVLIGVSWYTAENHQMDYHRWSGYAILALVLFRLLWGIFGSSTARFRNFVRGPVAVLRHARSLGERSPGRMAGHNPLGAVSVVLLLLVTLIQVGTGLFAVDIDGFESGPLSYLVTFEQGRWLAGLHHLSFSALQLLVLVHIAAIIFYLFYKRDNLILPMITGRRRAEGEGISRGSPLLLLLSILLAAACTWFVSKGLRF